MNPEIQSQVVNSVEQHSDEVVRFLQELVKRESVTGHEAPIQDFIASKLRDMGLDVDLFDTDPSLLRHYPGFLEPEQSLSQRPNVVGVWKGTGGGRSLLFNGHVDTVPVEPVEQWVDGPFSGAIRDGKLFGRGASDMKSGLAAMTMAVWYLQKAGLRLRGDVILEYTVDEERTGLGTLMCVNRGYRADAGISCETSDLEVMPACIGRMWFTIHVIGKAAGISAHWEGVSAIGKAIKIVQAIEDLEKMRVEDLHHPLLPDNRGALPCTVTVFQAGAHPSSPPAEALLRGSFGLMPYEDPKQVEQQLRDQVERVAKADPWLRHHIPEVTTEDGYVAAGAEIPQDHPIVQTVKKSFRFVTGRPPVLGARKGAADTRHLIRLGETPTVIFGPGPTPLMHAMNEYVSVDNLVTATKVLALAIYDWCNQPKEPPVASAAV